MVAQVPIRVLRRWPTHVLFEPLDFLARLAALVPSPGVNLTRYHGVFAPNHRLRAGSIEDTDLDGHRDRQATFTQRLTTRIGTCATIPGDRWFIFPISRQVVYLSYQPTGGLSFLSAEREPIHHCAVFATLATALCSSQPPPSAWYSATKFDTRDNSMSMRVCCAEYSERCASREFR